MSLDLIAKYYDLLYSHYEEDLPMWQTLAQGGDGPILEIGCGTGRLLVPLAQAGLTITGLDLSELALQTTQRKIAALKLGNKASLQQADMRSFDLAQKDYGLAMIPLNTFMHCHTIDDQLATLHRIHAHLAPEGRLVVDLYQPDPTLLAEADGRLYFEDELIDETTGHLIQLYWRHEIDLGQQMRHLVYLLDEIDSEGVVHRTRIPFSLRYLYRYEMELLLRLSGFAVETVYGDYDREPFTGHSPKMIFVARKV